jgi:hypothetical protein
LYLLAGLLDQRTEVRCLAFVLGDGRGPGESPVFIGLSSPARLREAIEAQHPQFQSAADEQNDRPSRSLVEQFESIKEHLGNHLDYAAGLPTRCWSAT